MKKMGRMRALFFTAGTLVCAPAYAIDLNGAWANDASVCDKVFSTARGKVSLARNADRYGSGFVIEGNRIRGKIAACNIKSRKDDGDMVQVVATCSTDVALSTMQLSFKIENEDKITRVFPGIPEMTMSYMRCNL